jgi:hypothetical protein
MEFSSASSGLPVAGDNAADNLCVKPTSYSKKIFPTCPVSICIYIKRFPWAPAWAEAVLMALLPLLLLIRLFQLNLCNEQLEIMHCSSAAIARSLSVNKPALATGRGESNDKILNSIFQVINL